MSAQKFFETAKYYEQLKEKMDEVRASMNAEMAALGIGTYHQDPETGTVYKIVKPRGTYVEYREIGYERTAQEGEDRGTLSKKEAQGAGFTLKK